MIDLEKLSIFLTISLIDSFTSKKNFVNRFSIFFILYNVQENIIGAISSEVIVIIIIIITYRFQNSTGL